MRGKLTGKGEILVEDVCRSYAGRKRPAVHALSHVSFHVPPGTVLGLLGPNGAGKTTCARIISTLLLPTSGRVLVSGADVVASPRAARQACGVTFGGEQGLYPRLTGTQNLAYFATMERIPPRQADRRIGELLARVGLADKASARVETYSRGMKQRLHIARALLTDPPVIVLDEPSAGLDAEAAWELRALVREAAGDARAVLLTTHDMHEAEALCHRLVVLQNGSVRYSGDVGGLVNGDLAILEVRAAPDWAGDLRALPGYRRSEVGPGTLRIHTTAPAEAASSLTALVSGLDEMVSVRKPTLEEAYLELVAGTS
jgi:ABC-2 type transport system ATP-binding protein